MVISYHSTQDYEGFFFTDLGPWVVPSHSIQLLLDAEVNGPTIGMNGKKTGRLGVQKRPPVFFNCLREPPRCPLLFSII